MLSHLKELSAEILKLSDRITLLSHFSPPYFSVKFKTRLKASMFGLNFLSDLTIRGLQPLSLLWLRHWCQWLRHFYSLLHPHLLYGIVIWASTFDSYNQRLRALQNRAIRIITNARYTDSSNPLQFKLSILKLL